MDGDAESHGEESASPAAIDQGGSPTVDADAVDDPSTIVDHVESYLTSSPIDIAPTPSRDDLEEHFFDFTPLRQHQPVDGYWVNEPFAYVSIRYDESEDAYRYHTLEPSLDDFEQQVRADLDTTIRKTLLDKQFERTETGEATFTRHVRDLLDEFGEALPAVTRWKLDYYFTRDFVRYGTIDALMQDPNIEDISCDGSDVPVYIYHRHYGDIRSDRSFGAEQLNSLAIKLAQRAGRHLSAAQPLVTTTLPDGSRIQVTLDSDVVTRGANFTIRKFSEEPFTPIDLLDLQTFSLNQMAYLWLAIEHNKSILFTGPTASGKTTSMNATSLFIPPDNKVVSIEETREIGLPHDNWIADVVRESGTRKEEAEITMYHLLDEALHQRPDYLLVGEIRTDPDVVLTFFQAIGTGHEGFTTFHAESSEGAVHRLAHNPLNIPYELIGDLDIISVQHLIEGDSANIRRCRQLTEVHSPAGSETDRPRLEDVFEYDPRSDEFAQVNASHLLAEIAEERGWNGERLRLALDRRQKVLAHLLKNGVTDYETVTDVLFRFARTPETVLDEVDESEIPELEAIDVASE